MKENRILIKIFLILLICWGCEDFQEQDISNITIHLNAPSDNFETSVHSLTFWWDSIDNAQKYNIQVVKKSFMLLEMIVMDTTIKKTKIIKQLESGEYEWRICAINGTSKAYSDTFKLTVQAQ